MQLRDLTWLVALATHGHVTDTAAVLGTSQPTLSRALARVEAELGTRLFERVPAGVVPNPDGELVLAAARDLVARHEQLLADLGARRDPDSGVVRLAFLDSMATSLVPGLLRDFHAEAPRVRVVLTQEPGHEILADLEAGRAELAVTTLGDRPEPPPDHGWRPLQDERLVLAVPPGHRWRSRGDDPVDLAEVAGDDLVTTPVGFGFRALVDRLLAEAGVAPAVSFESADLATIEGLVAAGLGVALLPDHIAGASGSVALPLATPAAHRTVGLTWRSDRELAPPAARFLRSVAARTGAASVDGAGIGHQEEGASGRERLTARGRS